MKKIIRFTASWCAPCKVLAKRLEGVDLGVPVEVIDIDYSPDLTQKYGVRSVPTLVMVEGDNYVKTYHGIHTVDHIKEWAAT